VYKTIQPIVRRSLSFSTNDWIVLHSFIG